MKNKKIKQKSVRVFSSNKCEDKKCPVCVLMSRARKEKRVVTQEEIARAMTETSF